MITPALVAPALLLLLPGGVAGAHPNDVVDTCDPPLRWHLAELDPRFALTREEATDAIRQAGIIWAEAAGRPLLFQEGSDGIAIRFVFDEAQAASQEQRELEAELAQSAARVSAAESDLEALRIDLNRHRTVHEQRDRDFQQRLAEYGRTVEAWNQAGGAPPEEYARLLSVEQALDREREAVNQSAEELNHLVSRVNAETERLNREISQHNERLTAHHAGHTSTDLGRAAVYREVRRGFGPFSVSVDRELDVFRFETRDHLVRLLVRELGRALGMEDSDVEGSVMHPGAALDGAVQLHATDVERIRTICSVR